MLRMGRVHGPSSYVDGYRPDPTVMQARLATCKEAKQRKPGIRPSEKPLSSLIVALGIAVLSVPTWAAERATQYSLHNGTIVGSSAERSAVTILIDRKYEPTWMQVQSESVQWREIPFAADDAAPRR